MSKILGVYDSVDSLIHIDTSVGKSKQSFLKLHETGHHELPTHRKVFRFFQDCGKTLEPEIADQFEREANNFARFALFQGDRYAQCAADFALEIKAPMKLAVQFGASIYASCENLRGRTTALALCMYWNRSNLWKAAAHVLRCAGLSRRRHSGPSSVCQQIRSSTSITRWGHCFRSGDA